MKPIFDRSSLYNAISELERGKQAEYSTCLAKLILGDSYDDKNALQLEYLCLCFAEYPSRIKAYNIIMGVK